MQNNPTASSNNQTTSHTVTINQILTKDIIKDKLTLRGFKSLNRKGIHSPRNINNNIYGIPQVKNDKPGCEKNDKQKENIQNGRNDRNRNQSKDKDKYQRQSNKQNNKDTLNAYPNIKQNVTNNNNGNNIIGNKKQNIYGNNYTYIKNINNNSAYQQNANEKYKKNHSQIVLQNNNQNKINKENQNTKNIQNQQQKQPQQSKKIINHRKSNSQHQKQYKLQIFSPLNSINQNQLTSISTYTNNNTNNLIHSRHNNLSNRSNRSSNRSNSTSNKNNDENNINIKQDTINNVQNYKSINKVYNNNNKYQNSPSIITNSHHYGYKNNKINNQDNNNLANPQNLQNNNNKIGYLYTSPIKYQNYNTVYHNNLVISPYTNNIPNNTVINQTISKDGNYKVVSKVLEGQLLKQAVQLQHNMFIRSKKQNQKQKQKQKSLGNVSPRNKYILDPSKISNKENGNIKSYAVNSNQGISRKYNQDRVSIILNINKNGIKASYFAIYDGHGGSNCCDFLTQNLHQYIFNSKKFPSNPRQAIIQGIKLAQDKFIQKVKNQYILNKQLDRSGSCAIIALIIQDDCYIVNVGDSRAILSTCQGKPMYSLSRDHKPTDLIEQKRILKEGGKIYRTQMTKIKKQNNSNNNMSNGNKKNNKDNTQKQQNKNQIKLSSIQNNQVIIGPLRVFPGKLSVTRTFGDIQAKQAQFGGIKNVISVDPQICKYSLTGKQDFIILGCDGIFQKLDSQQVIDQAWKTIKKNKGQSIHQISGIATQSIVKLCMDRKSTDNLTAIMICFNSLGNQPAISDYASV